MKENGKWLKAFEISCIIRNIMQFEMWFRCGSLGLFFFFNEFFDDPCEITTACTFNVILQKNCSIPKNQRWNFHFEYLARKSFKDQHED